MIKKEHRNLLKRLLQSIMIITRMHLLLVEKILISESGPFQKSN